MPQWKKSGKCFLGGETSLSYDDLHNLPAMPEKQKEGTHLAVINWTKLD
jgi:hypothetical protein